MLVKTKAIVISSIKYQEKSLIVKCFTQAAGLKSYFVQNAFSNKKSTQKIGYFQPLTILEIEGNHKNKGALEYFKEIKLSTTYQTINTNIFKSTIAIFVSEMLHNVIQEEGENKDLFSFLENALLWLDTHADTSNFHLILLLETTKYLGFYPEKGNTDLKFFDLSEGVFSSHQGITSLSEQDTHLFKRLLDLKFDSNQRIFSSNERQILLKTVLNYYNFHVEGFKMPKSLEVLTEIYH
jgi:DNA repair protein RecO (recombination protein O)